jgi:hypothetical protein
VETGGAPLHEATAARYPDDKFLTVIEGDYVLLYRRDADLTAPPPRAFPVFTPDGPMAQLALSHVAASPPGFFPVGPHGFRLHPNASDSPAARLALTHDCRNYSEFHLSLRVALPMSRPVRFAVTVTGENGPLLAMTEVLRGGESRTVAAKLEPYEGPCEVVFTTEMAEFGDSNAGAWAEVLAAAFA